MSEHVELCMSVYVKECDGEEQTAVQTVHKASSKALTPESVWLFGKQQSC